ncbi:uncharacterized protein LOC124697289 [Lolium rigidum]|uniref:uncharacterized protein LOC124697289 n=1 Tax=Lolium rigidum TaxID=89674 RepID=UPI001F5D16C9|nr:uncharacterized protein LOC124697289 [Lolium rigidum]
MYSLRLPTGGTRLGFALGRLGGGGAAHGGRRSVSATSSAAAPVPGDQGVGMDPAKHQPQPPPRAPEGKQQDKNRDDKHTAKGDVMTDSFGEGYSTRADEEGFGGVYGQNDPEHDTSQGSEAKHKQDNDKHAT